MQKRAVLIQLVLTTLLVALNLAAINVLLAGSPLFRFDLTEDREYSLTRTTRDLIQNLDEDLYIYGYFSQMYRSSSRFWIRSCTSREPSG